MKIVASTKLTRAQRAMVDSRTYGETSNEVFDQAETKPLEEKKTLVVICSSDKGLCGGIHSGLTRATRRMLEKEQLGPCRGWREVQSSTQSIEPEEHGHELSGYRKECTNFRGCTSDR